MALFLLEIPRERDGHTDPFELIALFAAVLLALVTAPALL
jgi:hypothetical protein